MFPKPRRIIDEDLLDDVRSLPCIACEPGEQRSQTDPDHLTTRGAGGGDTDVNCWPLCRDHHRERHAKGLRHMFTKYPSCRYWLELAGRTDILER